jgi:ketol-acid reductoisomerase
VDLMYRGGLNYMRYSVSDTAEHGDYTGGPQIVTEETRAAMRRMLARIQSGEYAREWIAENENGRPWFNAQRRAEQDQLIEQVGSRLRSMMPFVQPVTIRPDGTNAPAEKSSAQPQRSEKKVEKVAV